MKLIKMNLNGLVSSNNFDMRNTLIFLRGEFPFGCLELGLLTMFKQVEKL